MLSTASGQGEEVLFVVLIFVLGSTTFLFPHRGCTVNRDVLLQRFCSRGKVEPGYVEPALLTGIFCYIDFAPEVKWKRDMLSRYK